MSFIGGSTIFLFHYNNNVLSPQNFPWYPKPVVSLSDNTAGDLNDTACLIWFVPSDSSDKAMSFLEPLAKQQIAKWAEEKAESELLFYISSPGDDDDIRDSLRNFAKLPTDELKLVIVDIPDQKVRDCRPFLSLLVFYCCCTILL